MMKKLGIVPAVVFLAALFMVIPGSSAKNMVTMKGFKFTPRTITIARGEAITFSNVSKITHTASCDRCSIDAGDIQPGLSKTITFRERGTYVFYCRYHGDQGMVMRIQVGKPAPSPSPSAS